jgi:hypothetical protein
MVVTIVISASSIKKLPFRNGRLVSVQGVEPMLCGLSARRPTARRNRQMGGY